MYIVHVFIKVKEACIDRFKEVTIENARNSLREEGVVQFEVLQQQENSCEFVLQETYLSPKEQLKHRESEHFKKWKLEVSDLLVQEYSFIKYNNAFPRDEDFTNSENKNETV